MATTWIGAGRFGPPPTPFVPTDIAGLACWYDADDASSFTFSSGTVVSQWNDKSGNSRHMAQSSASLRPSRSGSQNGRTTVVFDGADDHLTFDAGSDAIDISPWTWFGVVKDTGGGTGDRIMSARISATTTADFGSGGAIFGYRAAGPAFHNFSAAVSPTSRAYTQGNWFLARSTVNAAGNVQVAVDGTTAAASAPGASAPNVRYLRLGATCLASNQPPLTNTTEVWVGEMAEIIMYNAELTAGEISTVESYLRAKWGTP